VDEFRAGKHHPEERHPGASLPALLIAAALGWLPAPAPSGAPEASGAVPRAIVPDGHAFRLEIADTPEERAQGYMYRSRVGSDEGMLFIFPDFTFHSFWMKNCLVSLDIVWLSDDLSIVHLERDVPPCRRDPCPGYSPMSKARYVLEIASGMAKKARLRVGEKITIEGLAPEKETHAP